jgi:hypothetical protein
MKTGHQNNLLAKLMISKIILPINSKTIQIARIGVIE